MNPPSPTHYCCLACAAHDFKYSAPPTLPFSQSPALAARWLASAFSHFLDLMLFWRWRGRDYASSIGHAPKATPPPLIPKTSPESDAYGEATQEKGGGGGDVGGVGVEGGGASSLTPVALASPGRTCARMPDPAHLHTTNETEFQRPPMGCKENSFFEGLFFCSF